MKDRIPARVLLLGLSALVLLGDASSLAALGADSQGRYFVKKEYVPQPLPAFAQTKPLLPSPIFDDNPVYVQMYWKAWELAFGNFYEPRPGSGMVSQFIDAAFNQNVFLWDTCFLTMFCNYGHPLVPGIGSLDNFYAKQHEDGEICREIDRATGRDFAPWQNAEGRNLFSRWSRFDVTYVGREVPQPPPRLTLDALAGELAREHLRTVGEVFQATGTVWEDYAPDSASPGRPAKPDFVGWTGIVPILYFIEYAVGLKPDAPNNRLTWSLTSEKRCGCERFRFNGHTVTLVAEPIAAAVPKMQITVESDGAFQLRVVRGQRPWDHAVRVGRNVFPLE